MCVLCAPVGVSAHPSSQASIITWGESVGWILTENTHAPSYFLFYTFHSSVSGPTKTLVDSGAASWNGTATIQQGTSTSGIIPNGYIYEQNFSGNGVVAECASWAGSGGHIYDYDIIINSYYSSQYRDAVFAHEFGHALGLDHVTTSANSDKLMYKGIALTTVSEPNAADRNGASVITGQHTSHLWTYTQMTPLPAQRHSVKCSSCKAYPYGVSDGIEYCTFTNNKCTKCGQSKI